MELQWLHNRLCLSLEDSFETSERDLTPSTHNFSLWKNSYIQHFHKTVTSEGHSLIFDNCIRIALGKQRYPTWQVLTRDTHGSQV